MRGTSGQVYTDNIVILQFKNLDYLCSPARRTRLWQAGLFPKKEIPILLNHRESTIPAHPFSTAFHVH
jgi:hypothetical protein